MSALQNKRFSLVSSLSIKKFFICVFVFISTLATTKAQEIQDIEYFFGNDPGHGNGTLVTATTNTGDLTQSIPIPITGLDEGFQTLTLRARDDSNNWGLYHRKRFYVVNVPTYDAISDLTAVEYWFGNDPGNGNGTPIALPSITDETTETFALPLGALEAGFQTLSIRIKNGNDVWSMFQKRTFYIVETGANDAASNLQEAEYWFDEDPGVGNGTTLAIAGTPDDTIENFNIPLGDLEAGFHTVSIRVKNLDGTWSLYHRKRFYVIPPIMYDPVSPLTEAEFLYDDVFGYGTGTTVAITPTANENEYLIEVPTDMVSCGFHDVALNVKNALGNYSLYNIATDIEVFDNAFPTIVTFPNIVVELDQNGEAPPFTIADVNNGTFDDCVLISVVLNEPVFNYTCADLGENTVTVTATDDVGKVSTLDVTVTVEDNINPIAIGQDQALQLDENGMITTTAEQVDNNVSTDNCTIVDRTISKSSFTCDDLGPNNVTLTVTDQSGNQDTIIVVITVEDMIAPMAIGQDITIQLDNTGNATTTAAAVDNNSTDNCTITERTLDISAFTCDDIGPNDVVLTVTDQSGNQDTTTVIVTVEDNINPVAITQDITIQLDNSGNVTTTAMAINNNSTDNCTITEMTIDISAFTCDDLGENTVMLTVTDQSGNQNTTAAIVTVEDNINPVAISQNLTLQLDANGNTSTTAEDVDDNSTDNCFITNRSLDISSFTCDDLGENTVTITITDQSGNQNTTTAIITIEDNINPVAIIQNITIELDNTGNVTTTADAVDNNSTDNCTIVTKMLDISSFTCADLGENTVMLTVIDQSGNQNTATAIVTVEDNINPVAIAQDIIIQLDDFGNVTTTAAAIDNNSTDNCTIASTSIDVTSFTCADLGDNTVTLTVIDQSGNQDTATINVTVEDNINPVAIAQNVTVQLDALGNASTNANDVNNGSTDNCTITDLSLSISSFTCNDLGYNTVKLIVKDQNSNQDTATITVTVEDNINPIVTGQDITIQLDNTGNATITADDVNDNSTDNCTIVAISVNILSFTCDDLGDNTVTLTVTDQSGNQDTASITVTVEDNTNPEAIAQDLVLELDALGNVTTTAEAVNNGSTDNCTITDLSIDVSNFTCNDIGDNIVTLTVTDQSGNQDTATINVTIEDNINPMAMGQDVTIQLDATGNASTTADAINNGSTDNCSVANLSIDISDFTCDDIGDNTVILTATDQSGNQDTATVTVTVEDNINPEITGQDITIQLDNTGNAIITTAEVTNSVTDNCEVANVSTDISNFTCDDLGDNTVILTVTDQNGNQDTATITVTVEDAMDPDAIAQDITVQLDNTGNTTITVNDIDNNSTDNCTIVTRTIDISSFTCADVGANTVTLTITDQSGNQDTATATVTVEENVNPMAIGQDLTVQLDASGNASITADNVDNNSTDNCGIMSRTLDITDFTCNDIGGNAVTLTVTDLSGNMDTAMVIITVEDTLNPTAIGQDITVNLEGNPSVSITANNVNNGSNDNCDSTLSINIDTFTAIGDYPVVLTIVDSSGNTNETTVTVTVIDEIVCADTAIWSVSGWDISPALPTSSTNVTITADYDTALVGASIDACKLTIDVGVVVTVAGGDYIQVNSDITVNGTLNVLHQGSIVQTDDDAFVFNNGTINVNLTTPELKPRDFMIMGSPMTAETRDGAFAAGYGMHEHSTLAFQPHPDVAAEFGVDAVNWADVDNNNWSQNTGIIIPGEGYLYRPQANPSDGDASYDITYEQGTLNNGIITFQIIEGDDKEDSPNVMANPYASAIFLDSQFFTENPTVNEVYFWEHVTARQNYPNVATLYYSMDDISVYNLSGGMMATNGGTVPNGYIATGQGFGIKANTGTASTEVTFNNRLRRTDNNNTLRAPETSKERLWLTITNREYENTTSTLLAFNEEATDGLDNGYDSNKLATALSIYSHHADGSGALAIQSREAFDSNIKVPMGFSTLDNATQNYTISLNNLEGVALNEVMVYLVDHLQDIVTNLSNTDYNFSSSKGVFNTRFTLQFKDRALNATNATMGIISLFPNPSEEIVTVGISNNTIIESVILYDITGRVVKQVEFTDAKSEQQFSIKDLASASYLVKIITDMGEATKQLIRR